MTTIPFNEEQVEVKKLEALVLADYAQVTGKILMVRSLTGYVGDTDEQIDDAPDYGGWMRRDSPVLIPVRVCKGQDLGSLLNWNNDWIDPYWDVKILDPSLLNQKLRSAYIFGKSYRLGHPVDYDKDFDEDTRFATLKERFQLFLKLL